MDQRGSASDLDGKNEQLRIIPTRSKKTCHVIIQADSCDGCGTALLEYLEQEIEWIRASWPRANPAAGFAFMDISGSPWAVFRFFPYERPEGLREELRDLVAQVGHLPDLPGAEVPR